MMDIGSYSQALFSGSKLAKGSGFFESAAETVDLRSDSDFNAQNETISFYQTMRQLLDEKEKVESQSPRHAADAGGHGSLLAEHAENEAEVHRKDRGQTICSLELIEKRRGIMDIGPFFQVLNSGSTLAKGGGLLEGATATGDWQAVNDLDGDNQAASFLETIKQLLGDSKQLDPTVEEDNQNSAYQSDDLNQLLPLMQLIENRSVEDLQKGIALEMDTGVASETSQVEVLTLLKEQLAEMQRSLSLVSESTGDDQKSFLALLNTKLGDMASQIKETLSNSTGAASNDETLKVIENAFSEIKNDIAARMQDQTLDQTLQDKARSVDHSDGSVSLIGGADEGGERGLDNDSFSEDGSAIKEIKGKTPTEKMDMEALFDEGDPLETDFSALTKETMDIDEDKETGSFWRNVAHQKGFSQNNTVSSEADLEQQIDLAEVTQRQDRNQRRSVNGDNNANNKLTASATDSNEAKVILEGFKEEHIEQKDPSASFKKVNVETAAAQSQASALDGEEDLNTQEKLETTKHQAKTVEADMGKQTFLESDKSNSSKETSLDVSFSDEESIVNKRSHTVSASKTAIASDTSDAKFEKSVMDQIVEKATLRSANDRSEVRIQLKPDALGDVRMSIVSEKNHLVVQMIAEKAETKEIIEGQLHHLKAELDKQGLTVNRIEVTISANGDQQDNREQFAQMFKNNTDSNGKRQNSNQREAFNQNQSNQENATDDEGEGINYFV